MTNQLWRTTVESGTRRLRSGISRRSFLRTSVAMGAAGAAGTALRPSHARLIEAALASDQSMTGSLSDVEHIVILMQENRSFDHYFGTMSDVRGFSDPSVPKQLIGGSHTTVFEQLGPEGYSVGGQPYLQPFELMSSFPTQPGQTTNDITHDWGPQHYAWNSGAMDQFLKAHLATDGATNGFLTMGYFTRGGLPFYHALADAFTICDGYFCSVIGPTHPNRLMQMSGSLGATGEGGAPVLVTYTDPISEYGQLNWLTMPEVLT
ncbi:MAG TPA: alkaline phosphatase family protein, partial [Candidatus Acidoferrum sp.]|nr:alkaline phosphatase family protein [Candidatus Acidoferrum sp.]